MFVLSIFGFNLLVYDVYFCNDIGICSLEFVCGGVFILFGVGFVVGIINYFSVSGGLEYDSKVQLEFVEGG